MTQFISGRPEESEYAAYYGKYTQLVPEADLLQAMARGTDETFAYLRSLPQASGGKRYAPDKWTVCQVIGHLSDTERVFAQRALFFARGDAGPLPGMEQDDWMKHSPCAAQPLSELVGEFERVRRSTLDLLRPLSPEAWGRRGTASGYEFSVRALAYIILGHERHHLAILKARYGL
jgi:hypothetical protein